MSLRKKKRERDPGARRAHIFQAFLWSMLIMSQMFLLHCLETRAAEAVKQVRTAEPMGEVEITSQLYDSRSACPVPPEIHTDGNGKVYERKRWEAVPVQLPARRRTVEEEQIFENVEGMTDVPGTSEIRTQDPDDGRIGTAVCQAESVEILREWWSADFSFPVQFHSYDADYYQLGGQMIPFDEERPQLAGCEELLLDIIGASTEEYRITDIRWDGEEYLDEAGILCRNALASGEKLVRDYQVRYCGVAEFPAGERWQTVAVYGPPGTEETAAPETESHSEVRVTEMETTVQTDAAGEAVPQESFWKQVFKVTKVILSLLIPLLLILLIVLVKGRRTWYTGQKENNRDRRT